MVVYKTFVIFSNVVLVFFWRTYAMPDFRYCYGLQYAFFEYIVMKRPQYTGDIWTSFHRLNGSSGCGYLGTRDFEIICHKIYTEIFFLHEIIGHDYCALSCFWKSYHMICKVRYQYLLVSQIYPGINQVLLYVGWCSQKILWEIGNFEKIMVSFRWRNLDSRQNFWI